MGFFIGYALGFVTPIAIAGVYIFGMYLIYGANR